MLAVGHLSQRPPSAHIAKICAKKLQNDSVKKVTCKKRNTACKWKASPRSLDHIWQIYSKRSPRTAHSTQNPWA